MEPISPSNPVFNEYPGSIPIGRSEGNPVRIFPRNIKLNLGEICGIVDTRSGILACECDIANRYIVGNERIPDSQEEENKGK
jgi:hypothetical protein